MTVVALTIALLSYSQIVQADLPSKKEITVQRIATESLLNKRKLTLRKAQNQAALEKNKFDLKKEKLLAQKQEYEINPEKIEEDPKIKKKLKKLRADLDYAYVTRRYARLDYVYERASEDIRHLHRKIDKILEAPIANLNRRIKNNNRERESNQLAWRKKISPLKEEISILESELAGLMPIENLDNNTDNQTIVLDRATEDLIKKKKSEKKSIQVQIALEKKELNLKEEKLFANRQEYINNPKKLEKENPEVKKKVEDLRNKLDRAYKNANSFRLERIQIYYAQQTWNLRAAISKVLNAPIVSLNNEINKGRSLNRQNKLNWEIKVLTLNEEIFQLEDKLANLMLIKSLPDNINKETITANEAIILERMAGDQKKLSEQKTSSTSTGKTKKSP